MANNALKFLWAAMLLLASNFLFSQITVTGTITDAANGQPLKSVSIVFKGSRRGTTSDADGKFTISGTTDFTQISFSYIGYKPVTRSVIAGTQIIDVQMEAGADTNSVYVKPHKVKYRNKDNPAVELIQKVIDNKDRNRAESYDYAQFQQYEKMQVAISNLAEKLKNSRLLRKYSFVLDSKDTSKLMEGRSIVPVYLQETITQNYYRKNPEKKKQIILADKKVNFGEYIDNAGVQTYLKFMYQDVDVYDNNIFIFTNQFLSPVAGVAPTFYMYTIMDTVRAENGDSLVKLNFTPRNPNDLLFRGTMYITLDGAYSIQKLYMSVSKYANLNWIREMHIAQQFEKDTTTRRYHLTKSELNADFGVSKSKKAGGMYGERTVSFKNFETGKPLADSLFEGESLVTLPESTVTDSFLVANRHDSLSHAEAEVYKNIDSLKNMRSFKSIMSVAVILLSGYKKVGPVDIGPIAGFYSFNPVEGFRLRFGGRTNLDFSKRVTLDGYGAYGFKDERWKYYGGITYSLSKRTIYQFPVQALRMNIQRDTRIPGMEQQLLQEDNFLLSFKRGVNDKWLYNRNFKLEWFHEMKSHFTFTIGYKYWQQEAAGSLHYDKIVNGTTTPVKDITASELYTELRWAPGEQFYQGKIYRVPVQNQYPIFKLRMASGFKGLLGGDHNYQNANLTVEKRFWFSQFGYADVILNGGVTLGQVPYPLLTIHRANQTYAYQNASYNLMNFLEFVSDHYASANIDYKFNGFIFNKLPLIKKLKLREAISFKILAGGLRSENEPSLNPQLVQFTKVDGVSTTYSLESKPYMEGSVGIMNIFKFIRVDAIRRFNYLDHPNVSKTGIRVRVKFDL